MNYVLCTGAAGFIGSHVCDELVKLNYNVIGLDNLSGGFKENVNKKVKFIKGDICDKKLIKKIFNKYKINYVFHMAAYAAENLSSHIKGFNYKNNLMGSINLLTESVNHDIKCFIFTSSIAVYGRNNSPLIENMTLRPLDSYGLAKSAIERELYLCHKLFKLNYIIYRPHNVYGTNQNIGDKYRNVIGIFMNQIMNHEPLTIFGDGEQKRAFTYIKDIAPIMVESMRMENVYNKVFNIGSDIFHTVNELKDIILKEWKIKKYPVKYLDERHEVKVAYSKHDKLKNYFDYKIKYSLKNGIKEMTEWVKKVGSKKSKEFKNIEIRKNLPKSWQ